MSDRRMRSSPSGWADSFIGGWGSCWILSPMPMRRLVDLDPERWVLRAEGPGIRGVRLHVGEDGDAVVAHLALDAGPEAPSDEIRNWEQERRADAELTLRLPLASPCAANQPAARGRGDLREVVGFRMDQETPFKADRIDFDYRVLERDASESASNLRSWPCRGPLRTRIWSVSALGIVPDALDVEDAGAGVNLLPPERRRVRESGIGRLDRSWRRSAVCCWRPRSPSAMARPSEPDRASGTRVGGEEKGRRRQKARA